MQHSCKQNTQTTDNYSTTWINLLQHVQEEVAPQIEEATRTAKTLQSQRNIRILMQELSSCGTELSPNNQLFRLVPMSLRAAITMITMLIERKGTYTP
jgi:hypothetical protein